MTKLYELASFSNDDQKKLRPAPRNVWKGKRLLLGLLLELLDTQRKALYTDIRRQDGEVICIELRSKLKPLSNAEHVREELSKLDDTDIFVTWFRCGAAYREGKRLHQSVPCVVLSPGQAYQQKKTIGTLAWLWYLRLGHTHPACQPAAALPHSRPSC